MFFQEQRNFRLAVSDKNITGDLFVGYGKRINCLYLGLELIGTLSSLTSKQVMDISAGAGEAGETLTTKTSGAWGASAIAGFHVSPTGKLYARLGFESRRFSVNFTSPTTIAPYIGISKSFRSTAFVPGVGAEFDITPRFTVRTEYRIAFHPKSNRFQVNDSADTTRFSSVQVKPTIHYFNVGLIAKM